ncbi:MAG: phage tail tube protein [Methylotenera sp.]
MAAPKKWSNVAVAMQSALGAVKTVTAITKAGPGVASSTAHGLANGTYGVLEVVGMYQVDKKIVRIANQATNTFELEGVDTTLFDTFTSGTFTPITFGTNITTATSINASGGDFSFIDTTTIHGNAKSQIPGLPNAATFTFDNIWDIADTGLIALKAASDNQAERAFRFTFGTGGNIMLFYGYVGASLLPGGSAQALVTTPAVITMNSTPSYYQS